MQPYRADMHIHTVLSPCGDLEMTPAFIVRRARECGLDMIGITDHNSTRQCAEIRRIGEREGVFVVCGAEVTTQEEVHCLAFMEDDEALAEFQKYLSAHLPKIGNDVELFGYQLVVNEAEEVLDQEPYLLISGLDQSLEEVGREVHRLGGVFIPAHIDKKQNSLLSQLGFVPPDVEMDALEISPRIEREEFLATYPKLGRRTLISSSDAHLPEELGRRQTIFNMNALTFAEFRAALRGEDGRSVEIVKRRA